LSGAGTGMSTFEMSSFSMAIGESETTSMDRPTPHTLGTRSPESHDGLGAARSGTVDGAMAAMAMPTNWTLTYVVVMFFMWWVMMFAMMLPSAAPMILLHTVVGRKAKARAGEVGGPWSTATFALGYLLAWGIFSVVATTLQWAFEKVGLLSPMMMNSTNTFFAGALLAFAGVYQISPIKQACLRHCRGPMVFLSQHWRPGAGGALVMGLHHGAYCLGCCWGLMVLLFFGGVMNLYWIIGLALIVLLEKMVPLGRSLSLTTGGLLLVWSASFFYRALA
jgi:predicted metal-binding membrane protein